MPGSESESESNPAASLVVELARAAAEMRRLKSKMIGPIGQIAAQSDDVGTDDSLAFRYSFRSTAKLVKAVVGCKTRTAFTMVAVANATRSRMSLTGQEIAPEFPEIGAVFRRGELSLESARAIISTIGPSQSRAAVSDFTAAERGLIELATGIDQSAPEVHDQADGAADSRMPLSTLMLVLGLELGRQLM